MVGELSVKLSFMALRSSAGVVSKGMSVVFDISCERLFLMSMRMAAWTYFLCSGVPSGGGCSRCRACVGCN